ncbi:VgrG-related protein [Amycolatopsis vastitatis]|uniref:Rhs element Vgr protein n=1 Tax=Amycolatopsis vastitatis TaxID=1905142 RepID=A0A229SYG8_9PSEU|nr:VgrG-related protein [Amycolatopsis vastitatis]OXM63549.1 rhs element Vgr protein [Amycolatopsis vastitatis]
MTEERRLDGVLVTVDGSPLRTELYGRLTLVHVEESVQLPDTFLLRFDDQHFELFDEDRFRLGTAVGIAFRAEGEPVVVTSGEVTAIAVEAGASGRHELVVTGLDLTHRLARGGKSRAFTNMTDADIARRIAGEYGLDTDIDGTGEIREHTLQHGETDYAFLRRIAGRIGYDFWITERKFCFKRKPAERHRPPVLVWGGNLHDFRVRFASADACDEVVVTAWDPVDKRAVTGRASTPDPGSDAPAVAEMAAAARRGFGAVTRRAGQFPAASKPEADARAEALLRKASGGQVVLRGEAAGNPWLGAGTDVQLDRVGRRLAGKYRVTSVEHIYGTGRPYVTRFVCGGQESEGLADLLRGGTEHRGWGSLVVAVVTNNDDKAGQARVKVRFPTLTDDESTWARVVAPGAGAKRGVQWLPEVGDEVLVGFENDDKARPLVLGGLWSRKDAPPEATVSRGGKADRRILASRKDHRLVLTDDPTSSIELKLGDSGCLLHLEQTESKLTGERKLVVTADRIEVKAGQKLVLEGPQVEITATGAVTVSGKPIKLN